MIILSLFFALDWNSYFLVFLLLFFIISSSFSLCFLLPIKTYVSPEMLLRQSVKANVSPEILFKVIR